jgi:CheY-like chemotaxis protein
MKQFVYGDPTRLQQVLMNLIVNSRDAMPDGGKIKIDLSVMRFTNGDKPFELLTEGQWVRLCVEDNGTGIPDDLLPHIFEPFVTTKPVGKGTGLGLAQIFGIVKQHQGYIDVQSEVGKGTVFIIYLPRYDGNGVKLPLETEVGDMVAGNGEMILLVEDNLSLQDALKSSLEGLNYRVLIATNGLEGVAMWQQHDGDIQVIISDVVMPEMSGISLFYSLREQGAKQPFVLMTGHLLGSEEELTSGEFAAQDLVELLKKPIDLKQLAAVVAALLQG